LILGDVKGPKAWDLLTKLVEIPSAVKKAKKFVNKLSTPTLREIGRERKEIEVERGEGSRRAASREPETDRAQRSSPKGIRR